MRTGTVNIHGKEYMICFSTRVIVRIEEKYGDYTKGLESILSGGKASARPRTLTASCRSSLLLLTDFCTV